MTASSRADAHRLRRNALQNTTRAAFTCCGIAAVAFSALAVAHGPAGAQDGQASAGNGELPFGVVTRFSGFRDRERLLLDPQGTVVDFVDLDNLLPDDAAPLPRLTAEAVGQVFAVEATGGSDPAIFLGASSAYGLYRNDGNDGWADGMWGRNGGPGTLWRYDPGDGVRPLANLQAGETANAGAGIGDIVHDEAHGRLFVSDLWSGMIHAVDPDDGAILQTYDHGVDGRSYFLDALSREYRGLDITPRDERAGPRFEDCEDDAGEAADFATEPGCWGFADFRRRVWGLGLAPSAEEDGSTRLYYTVWGGAALGASGWTDADDDARTVLWSIRLDSNGAFDLTDVRRELVLPALADGDEAAPGSNPVTDIAFAGERMLLAERGRPDPDLQATPPRLIDPQAARVLVLAPGQNRTWEIEGRYPAGAPQREVGDPPFLHVNAAGGVGLAPDGAAAEADDAVVWLTVDPLCTSRAVCEGLDTGDDTVAGLQGTPLDMVSALDRSAANEESEALSASDLIVLARNLPVGGTGSLAVFLGTQRLAGLAEGEQVVAATDEGRGTRDEPRRVGPQATAPAARPEPVEVPADRPAEPAEPEAPPAPVTELGRAVWEPLAIVDLSLATRSTGACKPGEACAIEMTVANDGPDAFDGPLAITETLGARGTSFVDGGGTGWRCRGSGTAVLCSNPALGLDPGEEETLRLSVRLSPDFAAPSLEACAAITWLGGQGRDRIRAVQAELDVQGFQPGGVDGVMGPNTEQAIRRAQADFGLPTDGSIGDDFVEALFGNGAARTGDEDADNDTACATIQVELPPRPVHAERLSSFHRQYESRLHETATSRPIDVHDARRSNLDRPRPPEPLGHDGRTSRVDEPRPGDPLARFHQRYESRLHDDRTSDLLPLHDRPVSAFHQNQSSRMHDPETSGARGARSMHRIDESRFQERMPAWRHDRRTSVEFYDGGGAPRPFDRDIGPGGLFHDGRFSRFSPPGG